MSHYFVACDGSSVLWCSPDGGDLSEETLRGVVWVPPEAPDNHAILMAGLPTMQVPLGPDLTAELCEETWFFHDEDVKDGDYIAELPIGRPDQGEKACVGCQTCHGGRPKSCAHTVCRTHKDGCRALEYAFPRYCECPPCVVCTFKYPTGEMDHRRVWYLGGAWA